MITGMTLLSPDLWLVAFPSLLCFYVMITATLQVVFNESRRPQDHDGALPSLAIIVPARNEEAVLADCLNSLLQSTHPNLEIHVVSDGSTDRTAAIAHNYAERHIVTHEFIDNVGKSHALEAVLKDVRADLVMVVDADTLLAPEAASEMAALFKDPSIVGATANIQVRDAHSLLTRLQALEYASIIGLIKRANGIWGGLFTVSGAASCFRAKTLREAGGFTSPSITEDIELSWRLQRAGGKLIYAPRAIAHIQVPETWRALWIQRKRWSQGLTEVLRLHALSTHSRNRSLIVFGIESLLCLAWTISLVLTLLVDTAHSAIAGVPMVVQFGFWNALTVALFACQTITATLLDSHYVRQSWLRLPLALVYPLYFLMLVMPTSLIGWTKGLFSTNSQRWERSERV